MADLGTKDHPWWKEAVFYQIYPASYKDSNGDGVGDIPGIISKLDYIKGLGVDAIWICPMYDSPQVDMGYDISNYEDVYPPYGTLTDMEALIQGCHERGMKIIGDLVINHTSDQHAWFKESRSSKDNPKRDWYIWRPASYDVNGTRRPPNNWRGNFNGSVWEWDEGTQEYYLHLFCPEQPDLNWENTETRKAIYKSAMEFWLDRGMDGFRVDTVNMYSKDPSYRDAEIIDASSDWQLAAHLYCNGPKMKQYLDEMNVVLEKYGAMTVGETPCTPDMARVLQYVSAREKQLNMAFQFDVVDVGMGKDQKFDTTPHNWTLPQLKEAIGRTQHLLDGTDAWTTAFMENHDQARSISRFGSDKTPELRNKSGKMLSMLLATLSGTLFIYQGQEIGMVNAPKSWTMDDYNDVDSNNYYNYQAKKTNNDPATLKRALEAIQYLARDHGRLPIQWDSTANGGFTTSSKPWQRVHDNYADINVEKETAEPDSVLNFWKNMLRLRKKYPSTFVHGSYQPLNLEDEKLYVYKKVNAADSAVVVLNFTDEYQEFDGYQYGISQQKPLVSNYDGQETKLCPFEGRIYVMN
ncbi:glycoside hydrolase [Microthyrium microscopicum]|uniref:Alpha-glucosidase n=1 Tax=Microthyrium microscopicum TaxID=703497 RepID=A0A6A6U0N1_9PEZI|nr:glycoside hydrolase [Microthyrium microscopicum]